MSADLPDVVLRHGPLRCVIARRGAELRSLTVTDDHSGAADEFIWQRDAAIWADSAPVLFPVIGRLKDGAYLHEGRRYQLPIHGFARFHDFELVARRADSATLLLRDSAATRAAYPFAFALQLHFSLDASGLQVRYLVFNPAAAPLLFSLGSHPGLRIPPTSGGLSDWSLLFDADEAPRCWQLDGDLLARDPAPLAFAGPRRIALSTELFARDALIFKQLRSRQVQLVHRSGQVRASVDTGGAPSLGLWARPGAAYVCIEPWYGYDDDAAVTGILAERPGIITLAPGAHFTNTCTIGIAPG
jgi:galactose mutarotase-like enzyme